MIIFALRGGRLHFEGSIYLGVQAIFPQFFCFRDSAVFCLGLRVPFVVSCCKFLKSIILKTFNEIALVFLSVESKTNILYVNINFNGNLFLGFGRYCGKVLPEPAVFHLFERLHSQITFFQYFFMLTRSK